MSGGASPPDPTPSQNSIFQSLLLLAVKYIAIDR